MNLSFEKSEELIGFLQGCCYLMYSQQRTKKSVDFFEALYCDREGEDFDGDLDEDSLKFIKENPLPTIGDIEDEVHEKCTKLEDYPQIVRMLFNEWENKLYFCDSWFTRSNPDDEKLVGFITKIRAEVAILFKKLSANTGVPLPNIRWRDNFSELIEKIFHEDTEENIFKKDTGVTLSQDVLDEVYNRFNDKIWHNVKKEDFERMFTSGDINLQIKNREKQRLLALLYRISLTISDEKARSEWVEKVQKIFDARLSRFSTMDEVNSKPNKEFNQFLNTIYSK